MPKKQATLSLRILGCGIPLALILVAFRLAAVQVQARSAQTSSRGSAGAVQILLPLYAYPNHWDPPNYFWDDVALANNRVPITAIINPSSGPGGGPPNADYVVGLNELRTAGVTVLGYVFTSYGSRLTDTVKADIDLYNLHFDIDGIFLDEVSNNPADLAYYRHLYTYTQSLANLGTVFLNPGAGVPESYVSTPAGDTAVIFENFASAWPGHTPDAYVSAYPPDHFAMLAHATDSADVETFVDLAIARNFGYVYLTDDTLPNPWDTLPVFWEDMITYIEGLKASPTLLSSSTPTATLTPAPVPTLTMTPASTPPPSATPTSIPSPEHHHLPLIRR